MKDVNGFVPRFFHACFLLVVRTEVLHASGKLVTDRVKNHGYELASYKEKCELDYAHQSLTGVMPPSVTTCIYRVPSTVVPVRNTASTLTEVIVMDGWTISWIQRSH